MSPLHARVFKDILGVGLLSAIGTVQVNFTVTFVTAAVGRFGADAIAGYGIASRLEYIQIPLLFGLGTAVVTMVGINIGAEQMARARRIAWIGAALAFGVTEFIGLAVTAFPQAWLGLFSDEPQVLALGTLYLRNVAPFYGAIGRRSCSISPAKEPGACSCRCWPAPFAWSSPPSLDGRQWSGWAPASPRCSRSLRSQRSRMVFLPRQPCSAVLGAGVRRAPHTPRLVRPNDRKWQGRDPCRYCNIGRVSLRQEHGRRRRSSWSRPCRRRASPFRFDDHAVTALLRAMVSSWVSLPPAAMNSPRRDSRPASWRAAARRASADGRR